jgi:2'-5' RNA ligase
MRLFFALEMPAEVRQTLAETIARLRPLSRGVRWVDAAGIHLTLRFLGEVQMERLEAIGTAARSGTSDSRALRLRTGSLGVFPERGLPRVVWIGLADDGGALAALQVALESAMEQEGFGRERRPFSPHLTLGRVKEGGDPRPVLARVAAPEPVAFRVGEFVLMESHLGPGGARYQARARFALREAA